MSTLQHRFKLSYKSGHKYVKINCINFFMCMLICNTLTIFNVIGSNPSQCF